MFKMTLATVAAMVLGFTSVNAQNRVEGINASNGFKCDFRTGTPAQQDTPREFLAYCRPRQGGAPPSGAAVPGQMNPMPRGAHRQMSPAGSQAANLAEVRAREAAEQQVPAPAAPTVQPAPRVAVQASAPPTVTRVFTPNVSIETLAAAFKPGATGDVLNAPAQEVTETVDKIARVSLSAEGLFQGSLIDCQEAGVKGKQRVGFKTTMVAGEKKFSFEPVDGTLEKCQPGQKLYVVKDGAGSYVAIADNSGYLLGTGASASGITINR